jgi:hypothetical protein
MWSSNCNPPISARDWLQSTILHVARIMSVGTGAQFFLKLLITLFKITFINFHWEEIDTLSHLLIENLFKIFQKNSTERINEKVTELP